MPGAKKAKVWFVARCERHGRQDKSRADAAPFIIVPVPETRQKRVYGGCPKCKAIEKKNETNNAI